MISRKHLLSKFKQVATIARRPRSIQVIFGICCMVLLWACCGPDCGPSYVPRHLRKYFRFPENYKISERQLGDDELRALIAKLEHLNDHVEVMNWEKYRPVNSETTIIVISVHKDVERLQYLIISLAQVQNIHQVLLVFSHSYFDDTIDSFIKSIDFCKVMQIYYPYSLQLNPNKFPGIDPDDCNVTSVSQADFETSSSSTSSPSSLQCYERDARRTQHKQHWWWTAYYVFERLEWSSNKQVVIFLEEDNYVLPDLLQMLQYTKRVLCYFPTVEVMSFGRLHAERLDFDMLAIDAWMPPYDTGLAFNKTTWDKIYARASFYCFYDDCSWSYSLVHLFGNFTDGYAEMAACSAPRVLSTSVFASGARAARWAWQRARRAPLFPQQVRASVTVGVRGRVRRQWHAPPRGNGGWGDLRDQMLCFEPLVSTTTEGTTVTTHSYKDQNLIKNNSNLT